MKYVARGIGPGWSSLGKWPERMNEGQKLLIAVLISFGLLGFGCHCCCKSYESILQARNQFVETF